MSLSAYTPAAAGARSVCSSCNYPEGECSGACMHKPPAADCAPTVLTFARINCLGLQNRVARRLRQTGCRMLLCSSLDDVRASIQIAPPPVHHRLRWAANRVRLPEGPPRCEAWMDGVRVFWIDDSGTAAVATAVESSHAA